jgi:two-component system response regulator RstA
MSEGPEQRILLVEDDQALASLLAEYLGNHGYIVDLLHEGSGVMRRVVDTGPDLVVLDLMLPDRSGLDVCKELRTSWRGPVLMLTAMKDDADVIVGLEVGADDYVGKPASPRMILARVRALLRRSTSDEKAECVLLGRLRVDVPSRRAFLDGDEISLTTTEFDLLTLLGRRAGRVQGRETLVEELRGIDFTSIDRSVDVIVSRLRRKLGDAGEMIRTVRGVGYVMALPREDER